MPDLGFSAKGACLPDRQGRASGAEICDLSLGSLRLRKPYFGGWAFGPKIPIEGKRSKKRATGAALSVPTEFHSGGSLENRERSSLRTARRTPVVDELDFRTLFPYRWAD